MVNQLLPRIVIAAPASGHGKTTIATGLMAALTRRGLAVSAHKVGPDYIDPGYHALATGRPGRNLDPFLCGVDRVLPLLLHGGAGADIAVIEGVMGLHDGQLGTEGFASTAHVARLTSSPIVLVVDVSHASRSIAAVVEGIARFDRRVTVGSVILNKVASPRHSREVRAALATTGLPVIGELGRDAEVSVPSRHLGLVPASERSETAHLLDRLAEVMTAAVDLDAILDLARGAAALPGPAWDPRLEISATSRTRPVVAMAGGRAFTFRYAEHAELLRAAGCDVVEFDPMTDTELPSGTRGLYLGGGFPEVHVHALARNKQMLRHVAEAVRDGLPTVAECAGLLYLCRTLDGVALANVISSDARMTGRLTLGYRSGVAASDHVLAARGTGVTGHEFHRTQVEPASGTHAWDLAGGEGHASPTLTASYLHVHWAGHPAHAQKFADAVHAATPAATVAATTHSPLDVAPVAADPLQHHGDREATAGLADFAVNVYEDGPPEWLVSAVQAADVTRYPDPQAAERAVARWHGRRDDEVLCTAGAAEAFTLLARARAWRHAAVVQPQFTEPVSALLAAGHEVDHILTRREDDFRLIAADVPESADLVIVGNPTNPTGVLHDSQALRALQRPGRVVAVDEAFMDGIPGEPGSLTGTRAAGLVVFRSLTKLWAIPGIRAGYVVGDADVIRDLRRHQSPWSVSAAAVAATEEVLTERGRREQDRRARQLVEARAQLVAGLVRLGFEVVPGVAPFVLVRVDRGTHATLRAWGFAVRRADTFPGLDDQWIRVAVRRPATVAPLLTALASLNTVSP